MKDIRLREFEELVLLCVMITVPHAYGASIAQALEDRARRVVSLGAIHTALDRLTRKGLVSSEMGQPTPVRGGRRRRYYELTPEGFHQVSEIRRIREGFWEKVAGRAAREGGRP